MIINQYKRTKTVMAVWSRGFGVIDDLMVVQHDCLSTPKGRDPGV